MALIGAMFVYSPHRPSIGLAEAVTAATKDASAQWATSVAASGWAPALADAVLRRTIADTLPGPTTGSPAVHAPATVKQDKEPGRH